jgi:pimeloyl-ACP methyl ester carboxylesterase
MGEWWNGIHGGLKIRWLYGLEGSNPSSPTNLSKGIKKIGYYRSFLLVSAILKVMQLVVNQLLTTYHRAGKGKVVLILHGWGDNSRGLEDLQSALATQFDVIVLDLPGFGGTQAPTDAWGLSEYAGFVAAALVKLKEKPYAIIGHSNGGAIAIRGLANTTLQAEKLVLLASAGIRNQYNGRNLALRVAAKTGKALTKPLPRSLQKKLRATAYRKIGSDMLVAEHMQETFKRVVTDDVQGDTAQVKIPSLLIYGYNDTATPVQHGELLQSGLRHSELHVVPEAGHFVHLDQPKEVTNLIQEFLK